MSHVPLINMPKEIRPSRDFVSTVKLDIRIRLGLENIFLLERLFLD